ncbi:hypothetical protein DUI87_01547 [Hirundo rustica rustica]|uniref:Uncharacterized protein n=1 Tax=Hirundo rustica rustica TaxID=333673 RepID=A0A3M0L5M0_HIRRU|nr:hypothetical protein DUI87_01547 [Hirundo rustica rustica]
MQAAANTPATQTAAKPDSEPKSAATPDREPKPAAKPDIEPKTLAVAAGKKHTLKTDRSMGSDPDEGPSMQAPDTKSEAQTTGTRSEATIESYSLKDLCGLRKDYTRQPDESIISWLVHLWDAAGEATILDGTEARHLGSLSYDPVIDQGMMREAHPCSL